MGDWLSGNLCCRIKNLVKRQLFALLSLKIMGDLLRAKSYIVLIRLYSAASKRILKSSDLKTFNYFT